MMLKRKTIIDNIYRLNYSEIEDKDSSVEWIDILKYIAELDNKELLKYYITHLEYQLEIL